jgi:hypothetical protein
VIRARVALVVVAVAAGLLIAGCASPRDALGPSESPCYQAIPVARHVAGTKAVLAGVRYLTLPRLEHGVAHGHPALTATINLPPSSDRSAACVIGFRGHFSSSLDDHAAGPTTGEYLLVVVGLRDLRELGALVLSHEPFRLSRLLPSTH